MSRKKKIKEQARQRQRLRVLAIAGGIVLLVVMLIIIGEEVLDNSQSVEQPAPPPKEDTVACDNFSSFSGQFVEDGSDVLVENVAAMLVTNESERFLDLATLKYEVDGKEATFVVTGLPAGKSAWVMEESGMKISDDSEFQYIDRTTSFRDGVVAKTDKISISSEGNMLTAVNNTDETLEGVFVYYKTLHTDKNFLGGITYRVDFGDLEPGKTVTKLAGHYDKDKTEIVRINWKEE